MNEFQPPKQRYDRSQGWQQQQGAWGSFGMETAARAGVEERMAFVRRVYALFFAACGAEKPFGKSAVERSTPERSAPVKSVSRKIATPMSAPENLAPVTFANRKFTLRN